MCTIFLHITGYYNGRKKAKMALMTAEVTCRVSTKVHIKVRITPRLTQYIYIPLSMCTIFLHITGYYNGRKKAKMALMTAE